MGYEVKAFKQNKKLIMMVKLVRGTRFIVI
jgi:hypothetical protein